MDPDVMAMLQKSISAKVISWDAHQLMFSSPNQLCPTVIGQACMDVVVNPPREGDPSFSSWKSQVWPVTWHLIPKQSFRLMGCWPLWLSEPSWWRTPSTRSRGSPATLCRAPCTPSPRFTCQRRPLQLPRRPAWLLMLSMLLPCLRLRASASFPVLALDSDQELSTSERPSLHRRTLSRACLAGELLIYVCLGGFNCLGRDASGHVGLKFTLYMDAVIE